MRIPSGMITATEIPALADRGLLPPLLTVAACMPHRAD